MKAFIIKKEDEGQRLDRYLTRILPKAGRGFLEKMLRKKNIVLNDKKASSNTRLRADDEIKVYFSDETFEKFSTDDKYGTLYDQIAGLSAYKKFISVIYEDEGLIVLDKPAGVLSQKNSGNNNSLNEYMLAYLIDQGKLSREDFFDFRPSVMNRLDFNTSGVVLAAKDRKTARFIAEGLKEKRINKTYMAFISGLLEHEGEFSGYITKDRDKNISRLTSEPEKDSKKIISVFKTVKICGDLSLVEARLHTGRSHQLRVQLAALGHPILFDPKYGDKKVNKAVRSKIGVKPPGQLLHSYITRFDDDRTFKAKLPDIYGQICEAF